MNIIKQNLQTFIKLTALQQDPTKTKWIMDEFDVLDKIESIRSIIATLPTPTGNMYRKTKYNIVEDLQKETENLFFNGKTKEEQILQRKRHGIMFTLIFEPLFNMLQNQPNVVQQATTILDDIENMVRNGDFDIGTLEEANAIYLANQTKAKSTKRRSYEDHAEKLDPNMFDEYAQELNFH